MFGSRENKLLRRALELYAGERVLSRVLREGTSFLSAHASPIELTMLYLDIGVLTTFEGGVDAIALGAWCKTYYEAVTRTVSKAGGTFDTFIGDSASAWWGVDGEPDHPKKAIVCSRELVAAMEQLNTQSRISDQPVIQLKIGIHTGRVSLGNFGSTSRLRYTVMGDNVNFAARLCSAAFNYSTPIVISEATRNRLGDEFSLKHLDLVTVKGKDKPVDIYSVAF
jgi:adenylate cyclase